MRYIVRLENTRTSLHDAFFAFAPVPAMRYIVRP